MIPKTATRVEAHTRSGLAEKINEQTRSNVSHYSDLGKGAIEVRLKQIGQEWDVERTLQTNFAIVNMVGVLLAGFVDRRWALFSAAASAFMLQHALQGWCPPLGFVRAAGKRTGRERDVERFALKAVRGDFSEIDFDSTSRERAEAALAAVSS